MCHTGQVTIQFATLQAQLQEILSRLEKAKGSDERRQLLREMNEALKEADRLITES